MNHKTRELALSAMLIALSVLITFSPVKLTTPFFTLTLGVHIPTMLAMFISPWVALMTIIGSCLGFFMVIPVPNSIIVVVRAATHIIFVLAGMKLLKKTSIHIVWIVLITALLHSIFEGITVYLLTPMLLDGETAALVAGGIAAGGSFVHHIIDSLITMPILIALTKAKIIKKRQLQ